ncbi:glycosyltransferase, partial [bacterium]|nr:glycosyltransferase [bacterium]
MMEYIFWTILFLIVYSLFGYLTVIFLLSKIVRKRRIFDDRFIPSVSMLISAYNEDTVIAQKIENFIRMDYPEDKLQILIGSDGSTDATNEILKKFENDRIRIFLYSGRKGKTAVLNNLIREAPGEIILFSDANTFYKPDAVRKIVR